MSMAAAAPAVRIQFGPVRHLALASWWFGSNFHWLPIGGILIQAQVRGLVPPGAEGTAIGAVVGAGGIFAVLVPPLVGFYSDHLTTRWGRRRPIMVVGVAGDLVGLMLMMTAHSVLQLAAGYLVIQLFANAAGAAYAGIIPDVVPDQEFGRASGYLSAMFTLGGLAGVLAAFALAAAHQLTLAYLAIAVVVVVTLLPVLWVARDEGRTPVPAREAVSLAEEVKRFVRPLTQGDFAWVIFTRLMMTAAVSVVYYFLSPFFRSVVHVPNPDQFTAEWLLVVFIAAIPLGFLGGRLSDRAGRKPFVYASSAFQGGVALLFIVLYPTSVPFVIGLGVLFGLGYGLYYAVDWALACDTLPDRTASAKDMGLFHVAYTLPQTIFPLVAGFVLDFVNRNGGDQGYRVVFGCSIVFFALGTVFVSRIRSVR
jgi:MFS family permease